MSDIETEILVGKLEERVVIMEKRQDKFDLQIDKMNGWIMATFGGVFIACIGVIANLLIALNKKP